jgi:hypothetical protein
VETVFEGVPFEVFEGGLLGKMGFFEDFPEGLNVVIVPAVFGKGLWRDSRGLSSAWRCVKDVADCLVRDRFVDGIGAGRGVGEGRLLSVLAEVLACGCCA